MTTQQPHIPPYAHALRIAAATEERCATAATTREAQLSDDLAKYQQWADGERTRIESELNAAKAKAKTQLDQMDQRTNQLKAALTETGRAKEWHQTHAKGADRTWRDWCAREGIDASSLPPVNLPAAGTPPGGVRVAPAEQTQPFEPDFGVPSVDFVAATFCDGARSVHNLRRISVTDDLAEFVWTGGTEPPDHDGDGQVPVMGRLDDPAAHYPFDVLAKSGLTETAREHPGLPLPSLNDAATAGTGAGAASFPGPAKRGE